MSLNKNQKISTGKYLLADMVGIISGEKSIVHSDYENEVFFYTPMNNSFVYGVQQNNSCMLSAEITDAKMLYGVLVELGITEFETEVEIKSTAFEGVDMLHAGLEL